ncbi:MAG: hypothetical protein L0H53_16190 [Candidatus Nitrosocosmicus sp.]|nr:hypothetical protein [Candidatus Nitrosocosmicus sp.]
MAGSNIKVSDQAEIQEIVFDAICDYDGQINTLYVLLTEEGNIKEG